MPVQITTLWFRKSSYYNFFLVQAIRTGIFSRRYSNICNDQIPDHLVVYMICESTTVGDIQVHILF